ncbi:Disease susceptibility protein LOV1 [Camellia lanceoleosa]|uniref:Disease susceptibility protein LOV1 n=1 Tax=Camellia lanceoleosa TaxID=1840588 RepID=A0ACC0G2P5_9ERIC|nr:Disease susceptibility protein LOV1 [Camellia lanceoleosa]
MWRKINLLAKNLKELLSSKIDLILGEKDKIQILCEDLQLLRTNLNDLQVKFFEHEQVKNLEARIRDLAYEAENTIDSFLVNIFSTKDINMKKMKEMKYIWMEEISLYLDHVKEEIEAIKTEMMGIYDMGLEAILQVGSCSSSGDSDSSNTNTNAKTWGVGEEEIMVGFEDEAMSLKEQLTGGPK